MAFTAKNKSAESVGYALRAIEVQRIKKATEHLLGICAGIIADARIDPAEIHFLKTWLNDNAFLRDEWPGRAIAARIDSVLDDGMITSAECTDLLDTLRDIVSTDFTNTGSASPDCPAVPYDDDPTIFFRDMTFCFTGRFALGSRATCERMILALDGTVIDNITQRLDYLIVGSMIEPQWAHTTFGRKIQKAVAYKNEGHDITIVSEQQWVAALEDIAAKA